MIKNWPTRNWLACGLLLVAAAGLICAAGAAATAFLAPSNSRDNQDPARQAEMTELTLKWGRLAPFPRDARDLVVRSEGSRFTRSFRISFNAPQQSLRQWIADSPGLREATAQTMPDGKRKFIITPGEGANYAEVVIDFEANEVQIYVSWS